MLKQINDELHTPFIDIQKEIEAYLDHHPKTYKGIWQDFWACALHCLSKGNVSTYMSSHRYDKYINKLSIYFNTVIQWLDSVLTDIDANHVAAWSRRSDKYQKLANAVQDAQPG